MTIKLTDNTKPHMITDAAARGVVAAKLYPVGVTTNSDDGVSDIKNLEDVLQTMQATGMVLCIHAETPGISSLQREYHYALENLPWLKDSFPRIKAVLEHATDRCAVKLALDLNMGVSVTVHHLLLTLDDVIGGKISPHCFCKPVAKTEADRDFLRDLVFAAPDRVFLGTDSAPHSSFNKECAEGAAGIYSAPVAMQILADIFDENGYLDNLEKFTSVNGANFYGLPLNEDTLTLVKKDFLVKPLRTKGVADIYNPVKFRQGEILKWSIKEDWNV